MIDALKEGKLVVLFGFPSMILDLILLYNKEFTPVLKGAPLLSVANLILVSPIPKLELGPPAYLKISFLFFV